MRLLRDVRCVVGETALGESAMIGGAITCNKTCGEAVVGETMLVEAATYRCLMLEQVVFCFVIGCP